jgi:predicted signal transduction protein with EAL and GGDEF domain
LAPLWPRSLPLLLSCLIGPLLRRFPFDLIKIDRSFIRDLERDPEAQAIVRAAVSLGAAASG